jgi:hypothetical protein
VALRFALVFADEIDLDVSDVGSATHEVVTHEAVEVVGRGDTGIDLVIGHFRLGADRGGHLASDGGGFFQGRAFRHVQDDLELALVVEGQHFHLHPADADGRHAREQQHGDADEEDPAPAGAVHERSHHAR